jgi:hypothetical protein
MRINQYRWSNLVSLLILHIHRNQLFHHILMYMIDDSPSSDVVKDFIIPRRTLLHLVSLHLHERSTRDVHTEIGSLVTPRSHGSKSRRTRGFKTGHR